MIQNNYSIIVCTRFYYNMRSVNKFLGLRTLVLNSTLSKAFYMPANLRRCFGDYS